MSDKDISELAFWQHLKKMGSTTYIWCNQKMLTVTNNDDDLFNEFVDEGIEESVTHSLRHLRCKEGRLSDNDDVVVEGDGFAVPDEVELNDSDDEKLSIIGSDDKGPHYPVFNQDTDLKGTIVFTKGLKFAYNNLFRKALQWQAIQRGYNCFFLHNNNSRVSIDCAQRCGCPVQKGRILKCTCKVKNKCRFKIHCKKLKKEESWQIKSIRHDHICEHQTNNPKLTSQYLAERYLVALELLRVTGVETGKPEFLRLYVCLQACKEGFLAGCTPILGVDGAHLKGTYPGILLTAVGKDGNNNLFPVDWAVVETENSETWGLLDAFNKVMPRAETKYCAETYEHFKMHMNSIKNINIAAYNYLQAIPVEHWSRHGFSTSSKSVKMIEKGLRQTSQMRLRQADLNEFEVNHEDYTYVVDLEAQTCSCGRWTLMGIPCWHSLACIQLRRLKYEHYVHKAYHVETYAATYVPKLRGMPGQLQWEQTDYPKPLPPPHRNLPGRPSNHKRKKEVGEDQERQETKKAKRQNR
ncbi:uncharacterized protein LOC125497894 [Beta vulgaris subsp. vulgaris]|uniref:uncharacterized protein LOC125497894 n=1 Tax=Beta vulgaris subsp. vulgaris TaxID=3555 RepID=UPI002036E7AF|nr:uncharacterized protein LOC125497894 [Beta vulgaris subsp. vulgaris]